MTSAHHLFLVPGFFGFSELGQLPYFAHVAEFLQDLLVSRGLRGSVSRVSTDPTASIGDRASRLADTIHQVCGDESGAIHVIGHSSGGLDARWLVSPATILNARARDLVDRVRSVVTVSTPHRGTPVADFFTGTLGRRLLRLLSLATIYTLRYGKLPLGIAIRMLGVFIRVDDVLRLNRTVMDQLYHQLLNDFSEDRRKELSAFFEDVSRDQALVDQLTPVRMDRFNREVGDRPGVRYGAVLTQGRAPGVGSVFAAGLDPYAQATHGLYSALHSMSVRWPRSRRLSLPSVPEPKRAPLLRYYTQLPGPKASDGLVPTLSQIWGELVYATRADHLDVVGHFNDPKHYPPHYDWLSSGSGFRRGEFERLWAHVFEFIFASESMAPMP